MQYQNLIPRFLKYVKVETRSDEASNTVPTTQTQVDFLKTLANEMTEIGLADICLLYTSPSPRD